MQHNSLPSSIIHEVGSDPNLTLADGDFALRMFFPENLFSIFRILLEVISNQEVWIKLPSCISRFWRSSWRRSVLDLSP